MSIWALSMITACGFALWARAVPWRAAGRELAGDGKPRVMGILNVTPDSFSDGGHAFGAAEAVARGLKMAADGADILDIGGESSRPGAAPVELDEELRRVLPVITALANTVPVPISIDTTKADVARRAIAAGATIVNDISALRDDPGMAEVIAATGAAVVLMHMRGTPRTMQDAPEYRDVVEEVHAFLAERIAFAVAAGIPRDRIAIDPGIGFGKTTAHNLSLLRNLDRFASLECALVVGTSRKRFLGELTERAVADRQAASLASALAAIARGADVVRVHDVGPTADAVKVWSAQVGD